MPEASVTDAEGAEKVAAVPVLFEEPAVVPPLLPPPASVVTRSEDGVPPALEGPSRGIGILSG